MDMSTLVSRSKTSRKEWDRFVVGSTPCTDSGMNQLIYQSWIRSRAAGVSVLDESLPSVSHNDKILVDQGYTDYTILLHDRFSEFYRKEENLLTFLHGVGLWVDSNLQVFHKLGDHRLISELKNNNIQYGTSFREDRIGTSAICVANRTGEEAWVVGSENYHCALKRYVTCSSSRVRQGFVEGFMMLVFPLDEFDELRMRVCEFILDAYGHLYDDEERLEVASRNMIIDATLKRTNSSYFVCDTVGKLVEASDEFYKRLHISPQLAAGRDIESVLSFSPPLTNRFASGKEDTFSCVITVQHLGSIHHCTVESFPVKVNSPHSSGALFVLTDAKSISTFTKKMANKNPYYTFDQIIGRSEPLREAINLAITAASSQSNILIQGSSGTGKELFAQAIHNQRFPDMDKPFVDINCGALPRDLLNTELFGYVDGAFTGARKGGAPGKFEIANGGTLFFDEIGEMPLEMQSALLRALEEHAVTRVGGATRIPVDVRIVSATNKDLHQMVQEGKFRLDLYYRLNVMTIRIPPLCERKRDIILLANHFIKQFATLSDKSIIGETREYEHYLLAYDWPGNVRELKNIIERSVNLESGPLLSDCTFLKEMCGSKVPRIKRDVAPRMSTDDTQDLFLQPVQSFQSYEKKRILDLLIKLGGNKSKVAEEMSISRKTLYNKMHKYGIEI